MKVATRLEDYRKRGARIAGKDFSPVDLVEELRPFSKALGKDFRSFKSPEQELTTWKVLAGESVLAVMPTGSGKSLTYQLPAFLDPRSITLVISPLKALMEQHAEAPWAHCITGDVDFDKRKDILDDLREGRRNVLLLSPEMLAKQYRKLWGLRIRRFVVDEVHCLSDWGHDFRPHYWWVSHFLRLIAGRKRRRIPVLLLTATADERVLRDIRHHFPEVSDSRSQVRSHLGREEIVLLAKSVDSPRRRLQVLRRFLLRQARRPLPKGTRRRGIVFNLEAVARDPEEPNLSGDARLKADQVVRWLRRHGIKRAYPYSAKGMKTEDRRAVLRKFERASATKGQLTVVVATNAFGMGMDYDRIPFVCHLYPRPSVMELWQQIGRAGRGMDLEHPAEALALHAPKDLDYARQFAKAPALDGLLNSLTIPLHGWMYVWTQRGADMCLVGKGGGTTRFARLLKELQELDIVGENPHRVRVLRGTRRYRVDLRKLRSEAGQKELKRLRKQFWKTKRLRKVFRYLEIAAISRPKRYIVLDQTEYRLDKRSTVLQRLNRWVDVGLLKRDDSFRHPGQIRLLRIGRNLTDGQIKLIARNARAWGRHKTQGVDNVGHVLRARSPHDRRKRLVRHFGERRAFPRIQFRLPRWLKS